MTKYKRFTGKVFGGTATATGNDPQISQFGSALAGTFTGTTDPEVIQSLPAWGQGWIGAVTPNTQFPALPEMTGAMKVLSYQICGIQQQGISDWDNGTIYYQNNFTSKNGKIYISQIDENQGNDPETDTVNWKELLQGKAKYDANNFSDVGKSFISGLGMPSNKYIDLTLGASGSYYTAPANGYFVVKKRTTSTSQYLYITSPELPSLSSAPINGQVLSCSVKAAKGEKVMVTYTAGGETIEFRFYYVEGAK